jgi:hypothetical protein
MKYIFAFAMILALSACSVSSDNNGNKPFGGDQKPGEGSMVNETDYSQCGNFTPAGYDIGSATWAMYQSQNELNLGMFMRLEGSGRYQNVRMTSTCQIHDRSLSAQVVVAAQSSYGNLEILEADQKATQIDEPGFKMNCNVSIRKSRMTYTFKGRCLELSQAGSSDKIVMVPL